MLCQERCCCCCPQNNEALSEAALKTRSVCTSSPAHTLSHSAEEPSASFDSTLATRADMLLPLLCCTGAAAAPPACARALGGILLLLTVL